MQPETVETLKEQIVIGSRILLRHQVLDGFGHVSARIPGSSDRFLLSRRIAPGLIGREDILEFGLDGEPVSERGAATFLERHIHSGIYTARADVMSIVHSHSPAMVTLGIVRRNPLRAVCHTCGFLGEGVPLFEIRDTAGDETNLLVSSPALGEALAFKLGNAAVVLMRGHGFTAVGGSIPQAVYRAIYSEVNARIQTAASALGDITYLSPAEAAAAEATSELQVERTWASWREMVTARV